MSVQWEQVATDNFKSTNTHLMWRVVDTGDNRGWWTMLYNGEDWSTVLQTPYKHEAFHHVDIVEAYL